MGVGASAGGLDAFKAFFSTAPADAGMAFVLVQHLDPKHESSLATIVGGYTAMPVRFAEDGAAFGPNQVHVVPPDAILTVRNGRLRVSRPAPPAARRTAVNTFLSSLAQDQGENAVGIILSGSGSDGALGVAAIKEHGGLTLSQAEFDHHAKSGMPQSAASGGFVDHVLPAEDMPAALLDYQRHRKASDGATGADGVRHDLESHLATICAVLRGRLGRDFSQYKPGTLMRRIQRRMHVLGTDEVPAYVEQLRTLPDEAELLFRELLIGVTRFFRDPEAFAALEARVLPGLLAVPRGSDPIRAWVAGCATGEEAYSLAILLREGLNEDLLATRERLRSLTEGMEAANEELRSANEELQTINAELNVRNESLVRSNSDLANLLDSTSIATLFLDGDLRIRRFTPRLLDIFKVREGDEGRPISDIVTRLTRDGLGQDVGQVLRTLAPVEREVTVAEGGASYLMRVRPYRGLNNVVDGATVTFVDISERKQHEQARARLAAIVESSQDAVIGHDLHGVVTSWNAGAEQLYGYPAAEAVGRLLSTLLAEGLADNWPQVLARLQQGERIAHFDGVGVARDGRTIDVSVTISPVREADGRVVGASVVARDISERRKAERKAGLLLGELDHRVKNILAVVSAVVSQTPRDGSTPDAFAAEVQGRIQAIAQAHGLLTQAGQGEIALRALIATELAPYGLGRAGTVSIEGDDVALTPRAGMALALAVHELASNAAKYGALSTPAGRLAVTWTAAGGAGGRTLAILWAEAGGPPVRPPSRRGFGTTLIERALSSDLDAEVSREFLASGLRCAIRIPLTEEVGHARAAAEAKEDVRWPQAI